jgi:hypothetical protein
MFLYLIVSYFVHGEGYSIQHYVIKFVRYLRQMGGFRQVLQFPPPINLPPRYTEILLKVALNTIKPNLFHSLWFIFLVSEPPSLVFMITHL